MNRITKFIAGAGLGIAMAGTAAAETIKVGVLQSLSGTMAI